MKIKRNRVTLFITLTVAAIFAVLCFFDTFQKLDFRLYDALLHLKKQPPKNEKIVLLEIDDDSIDALGEWPWSRDIIADAMIRLKEFEAFSASFDIEYVSPSKNGISSNAQNVIKENLYKAKQNISDQIIQVNKALSNNFFSENEKSQLKSELLNQIIPQEFDELSNTLFSTIFRDNDEYFGQSLQFFGNSFLTINTQFLGITTPQDELDYVKNRMFLDYVADKNHRIKTGNIKTAIESDYDVYESFSPAMNKLVSRAGGVGFVNSVIDSDGTRRRMELLHDYDGKFACTLSFAPLLKIVDSSDITVNHNSIIIHNAKMPDERARKDIKIPVDSEGRILINWRRGDLRESFNTVKIIDIIDLDIIEQNITACLNNICLDKLSDENGYEMQFSLAALELIQFYNEMLHAKNSLLQKCTGYSVNGQAFDGISDEEYAKFFKKREDFYSNLDYYLECNFYKEVLVRLDQLKKEIDKELLDSISANLKEDFTVLPELINLYKKNRNSLKDTLKNSYCIIGNTSTGTTDLGSTPFEKKYENVGIHANVMNTILNKSFIIPLPWYIGYILTFLVTLIYLFLKAKSTTFQNTVMGAVYTIYILIILSVFILFSIYLPFVPLILMVITNYLANFSYGFYISSKEKKFITMIASSFANKDTVDQLKNNPDSFKTEGEKKHITALFSDIQKFSSFSEKMDKLYGEEGPNRLIKVLNEYLGDMSKAILSNNGNIDKYEGDAIISMFGAPDPAKLHTPEEWAYYALDSACKMKQTELEFNRMHYNPESPETSDIPNPLYTRIGLNTGAAFVGLMGSMSQDFNKVNYTMIGDTVNLAARLEGVNKAYNSWIMCSDTTWNMANQGSFKDLIVARPLDKVRVVGKSVPVQLYNVINFRRDMTSLEIEQVDIFNAAMERYLAGDFTHAGKLFIQANSINGGDPTALVFAERVKNFIENGVPKGWDGVVNLTEK